MASTFRSLEIDSLETERLLQQLEAGDVNALDRILESHRGYLRRMLELRMGDELHGRVDASDVIQETQLVVSRRIDDFLERRPTSFKLWLRHKAIEQMISLRSKHVLADKRSIRREAPLGEASSLALVAHLMTKSPSEVAQRCELVEQANAALSELGKSDREVLLLRHFEELTNAEVAELLEISPEASSKRYGRAILRLRAKLVGAGILSGQ